MKLLRTLSTTRLIVLLVSVAALAATAATLAVAASGGSSAAPPAKALPDAIHDALAAPKPQGIFADIVFTNKLFPSGALLGQTGSALMSGATGRLWATNDGRGRIELQASGGNDVQIVWNTKQVTVFDASSNTTYRFTLPAKPASTTPDPNPGPPSLTQITDFLAKVTGKATVSGAQPSNVAGQPAYTVEVSPRHDGGLLGSVELAFDAAQGVPLRVAVYAQGSSSPVLELKATDISYRPIADGDVNIAPPSGAKVVDVNAPGTKPDTGTTPETSKPAVTGLPAVTAAAGFTVNVPDTLVGLPLKDVRLVGGKSVVAVYGQGLGAIVLVERKTDTAAGKGSSPLSSLPTVALDGVSAHELATQLGTVLEWQRGGVDYVLAGSLQPSAAEAAARSLK